MDSGQLFWWKIALELRLRRSSGDAFQDFFCSVMGKVHGDDFVRVRAFGSLGDKGCDGYLQSCGQVFQCYGALNSDNGKVAYLIGKMGEDFDKALAKIPSIMREWHMAHNLVDGLPIEAVETLEKLRIRDKHRKFGFIGLEGFEERIFGLDEDKIESLLGIAATSEDQRKLQPSEIRDLVSYIAGISEETAFDLYEIRPVSADKLSFNKLPGHWRALITAGWQNAHLVANYLDRHPDPLIGERVALIFRTKYQYLKSQNLSPGETMSHLFVMITGEGTVSPARQIAAQALLAFLFESCDIFEDVPNKVAK